MNEPVKIALVGAGCRGSIYAKYAKYNGKDMKVVAVAEPREYYRKKIVSEHFVPERNVFEDWRELILRDKFVDAVIIATQDHKHIEPALAFIDKGYNVLLEKPMAPTAIECSEIANAAMEKGVILAVCHVLRYTESTKLIKEILDSGMIGEVKGIQHLEPIGYWHYAHSYVRGNWRKESISNFLLMTKSCHDLDWLRYIAGAKCVKVSSFGRQTYFNADNKPKDTSTRCLDCKIENECPYSARKIYLEKAMNDDYEWPVDVITDDLTIDGVKLAIEQGPYGRCVFECDNDVVDHQVVNMEFANGVLGSFTMSAFSEFKQRETRVFGTKGELYSNGEQVEVYSFLNRTKTKHVVPIRECHELSGHGGGDYSIMEHFVNAVRFDDRSLILSGPDESLETHLSVFAAEESRKKNQIITL